MSTCQHDERPAESGKPRFATEHLTHDTSPQIVGVGAGYPPGF
jgi:hypothetical protein